MRFLRDNRGTFYLRQEERDETYHVQNLATAELAASLLLSWTQSNQPTRCDQASLSERGRSRLFAVLPTNE